MSQESGASSGEHRLPAAVTEPQRQPCPKCHGEMVEGWVPASDGQYANLSWFPGAPVVKQALFGTVTAIAPPNLKERIPLTAFRCVRCGFVEFYARAVG